MKVEITDSRFIHVQAESTVESLALEYLVPPGTPPCKCCGDIHAPILISLYPPVKQDNDWFSMEIPEGVISHEKWIRWQGGECPVDPVTEVEVELRCGLEAGGVASKFEWGHIDSGSDILRYRVIE